MAQDSEIRQTAQDLIAQHGADAPKVARTRLEESIAAAQADAIALWQQIEALIVELIGEA